MSEYEWLFPISKITMNTIAELMRIEKSTKQKKFTNIRNKKYGCLNECMHVVVVVVVFIASRLLKNLAGKAKPSRE